MDPVSRRVVGRGCARAASSGRAVLLSTHALPDARALAHKVALLRKGELAAVADNADNLHRYLYSYHKIVAFYSQQWQSPKYDTIIITIYLYV